MQSNRKLHHSRNACHSVPAHACSPREHPAAEHPPRSGFQLAATQPTISKFNSFCVLTHLHSLVQDGHIQVLGDEPSTDALQSRHSMGTGEHFRAGHDQPRYHPVAHVRKAVPAGGTPCTPAAAIHASRHGIQKRYSMLSCLDFVGTRGAAADHRGLLGLHSNDLQQAGNQGAELHIPPQTAT